MLTTEEKLDTLRRRHRRLVNAASAVIQGATEADADHALVPIAEIQRLHVELEETEPAPFATMSAS